MLRVRSTYVTYFALFFKGSKMALGPTQLPTGGSFPGGKPVGGDIKANNSPPPSAKVTNAWSYTSPPHIPSRQGQFYFVTGRIQGLSWLPWRREKSLRETLFAQRCCWGFSPPWDLRCTVFTSENTGMQKIPSWELNPPPCPMLEQTVLLSCCCCYCCCCFVSLLHIRVLVLSIPDSSLLAAAYSRFIRLKAQQLLTRPFASLIFPFVHAYHAQQRTVYVVVWIWLLNLAVRDDVEMTSLVTECRQYSNYKPGISLSATVFLA